MGLKLQKRLAGAVLGCGKNRTWLNPAEGKELALANSRAQIRKLAGEGLVQKRAQSAASRFAARQHTEAKRRGRHQGAGRREGSRNARLDAATLWMRRQRVLRRLLRAYRATGKIDRHTYHAFYLKCKGNVYRNKRVLIDAVHLRKNTLARQRHEAEEQQACKAKAAATRAKRQLRQQEKRRLTAAV